jgi:hypothetical protein
LLQWVVKNKKIGIQGPSEARGCQGLVIVSSHSFVVPAPPLRPRRPKFFLELCKVSDHPALDLPPQGSLPSGFEKVKEEKEKKSGVLAYLTM